MMRQALFIQSIIVALLGVAAYYLGLFDKPDFVFHDSFLPSSPSSSSSLDKRQLLYVILATTTERNIGAHVGRLLQDTKKSLDKIVTVEKDYPNNNNNDNNNNALLSGAAKLYGAPNGAESLSVGLYFDDPNVVEHPRWGIGWAIDVPSFDDAQEIRLAVQNDFPGNETIRAVRIGGTTTTTVNDPILKAQIPWRSFFTPMIAPMLHWSRGFETYNQGGYTSTYQNKPIDAISCEVYVTGANDSMEYIDYVVLMGDLTQVYDDCFPSLSSSSLSDDNERQELNDVGDDATTTTDSSSSSNTDSEKEDAENNNDVVVVEEYSSSTRKKKQDPSSTDQKETNNSASYLDEQQREAEEGNAVGDEQDSLPPAEEEESSSSSSSSSLEGQQETNNVQEDATHDNTSSEDDEEEAQQQQQQHHQEEEEEETNNDNKSVADDKGSNDNDDNVEEEDVLVVVEVEPEQEKDDAPNAASVKE